MPPLSSSYRVRAALTAAHGPTRHVRSALDGLLEEIQGDVLDRHPEWRDRIRQLEGQPVQIVRGQAQSNKVWADDRTNYNRRTVH